MFQQRFNSALRPNVYYHSLWGDDVLANAPLSLRATFHPHADVTDAEVARLRTIDARVRRWLRKHGKLHDMDEAPALDPATDEPTLLQTLGAVAIQGPNAPWTTSQSARAARPRQQAEAVRAPAAAAEHDGFSLHAGVRIPKGCRAQFERMCRYAARPSVAEKRGPCCPTAASSSIRIAAGAKAARASWSIRSP